MTDPLVPGGGVDALVEHPPPDPMTLLRSWLLRAPALEVSDPMVVSLSTLGADGTPSSRFVALTDITDDGVVFATSAKGPKGRELAADPHVALAAYWAATEQQYRIKGVASALEDAASDRDFAALPRAARAAAAVARQSAPVQSWAELDQAAQDLDASGREIERPAHWRSWLVTPTVMQFWSGSPTCVHRRLAYTRTDAGWTARVVQP
ncbi:pyridoxine/pyridoxamine 5'-phosphate oxidase [Georgenia sp. MJ170]|uniref:pyridoxine/pyridoxamine 5'-phosphate oxidase n=1 Tax=Georgenia sunbinii TaxID=3117728 RepID=UPI002F261951